MNLYILINKTYISVELATLVLDAVVQHYGVLLRVVTDRGSIFTS